MTETMESIRETQKQYGTKAMVIAIVIAFGFILVGLKPEAKGLILGTIFSVVNFVLIGETLPMRVGRSGRSVFLISLASIFFRYLLMAIPLIVAIKFEQFNVFAVIPGLFMIQGVILADQFGKALPLAKKGRANGKVQHG